MNEFNVSLKDITSLLDECEFCEEYEIQDNSEEWELTFIVKQEDGYDVIVMSRLPEWGVLLSAVHYCLCDKEPLLRDFIKFWNNDSNHFYFGMRLRNDKNTLVLCKSCLTDFGISKNTFKMEIIMLIDALRDVVKELKEKEILDEK